ncbi:hypothetical protein PV703_01005 [Streptomyces sp. ME01-24h]|nr:hypothetical protein [Streptomyces sp. ME19-03-3]MDX3215723.1 hypothetical protein [Streptomyces sp. ME02-6991-2B]MDX3351925.1 hypothetical protein [Streptomyces sp. ME01-24h]MDX3351928.1 hypothetical protein [Streptomyces sp. ME01-24h]
MTAPLRLADAREADGFAAFLARLLRWDKAAVVRLRASGTALAVFGQPPFGAGVLAVRTAELDGAAGDLDSTVSAGQLLDGIDDVTGTVAVPAPVTGPAWAGLLPPRGGWERVPGLPSAEDVRAAAAAAVTEFRERSEALPPGNRTRVELDAIADDIWSRQLGTTGLPLRVVHAAHALGFLRPVRIPVPAPRTAGQPTVLLLAAGPWLRLRTPYGSVAVRRRTPGLRVSPV